MRIKYYNLFFLGKKNKKKILYLLFLFFNNFFFFKKKKIINIIFVDLKSICLINFKFRGFFYKTNILVLKYHDSYMIYLCIDIIFVISYLKKNFFLHEFFHTLLHGVLHILEYDHTISKKEFLIQLKYENILKMSFLKKL